MINKLSEILQLYALNPSNNLLYSIYIWVGIDE